MPEPVRKEDLPESVQTYSRDVGEIAARIGRTRDCGSKSELSRRVKEEASDLADFIISRARR